jgi:uncharacterized metal-binding protein YceD (DUF177 family)
VADVLNDGPWRHDLTWRDAQRGLDIHLEPDAPVRAGIARLLGLEAAVSVGVDLHLSPWLDGVEINGTLNAVVTRICGVSLDPFDEVIDEPVFLRLVPAGSPNAAAPQDDEIVVDIDADDPPDVVEGEAIDLGHYVVEQLALALDPFPRKPDAVFEAPDDGANLSPFAALAALNPLGEPK